MFAKGTEITHAVVVKKLNEILQARGKKGTDRYGGLTHTCGADPHMWGWGVGLTHSCGSDPRMYGAGWPRWSCCSCW